MYLQFSKTLIGLTFEKINTKGNKMPLFLILRNSIGNCVWWVFLGILTKSNVKKRYTFVHYTANNNVSIFGLFNINYLGKNYILYALKAWRALIINSPGRNPGYIKSSTQPWKGWTAPRGNSWQKYNSYIAKYIS